MIKIKGTLNENGEVVFQRGKPLPLSIFYQLHNQKLQVEITLELSFPVGLNTLISGIDGFVWATKDFNQAEIICNALKVQKIETELATGEINNKTIFLIKVNSEEDFREVIDFIQNDSGGLRLKRDWDYPDGERNQSFEQWIND